jgi:hypothetical protein
MGNRTEYVLVFGCAIAGCLGACSAPVTASRVGQPPSAGSAPAGGGASQNAAANRWSHVDFVERYSFDGAVVQSKDLSGIACVSPTRCLIGADEGREVQVVELSRQDRVLKVLKTVSLAASGKEIDAEAIAVDGDAYYIIGSHGVAKKTGSLQGNRYKLFRLKVDPNTGLPDGKPASLQAASLVDILRTDPVLGKHFDKPLQRKGVNIEGLAARKGTLYIGFRNPNVDGSALVLEVQAAELFAGQGRPKYTLHKLALGKGLGIREIVAARSCFFIIAGNAGSEPSEDYPQAEDYDGDRGFSMFAWNGPGSEAYRIAAIPNTPAKAEAMTILDEAADQVTVLVLFDGVEGSQPTVYRIH